MLLSAVKQCTEVGDEVEEVQLDCRMAEMTYATILDTELAARVSLFGPRGSANCGPTL